MTRKTEPPLRPPEKVELAQQKADFTAEGSPPPGRVATTVPERLSPTGKPVARRRAAKATPQP